MVRIKFPLLALAGLIALCAAGALTARGQSDDDAFLAAAAAQAAENPGATPGATPALPPGHPAVPAAPNQLPPGHPPMPGGQNLPSGHPAVGGETPTTQPVKGSLTIKSEQGTKGGPSAAGDEVLVEFYTRAGVVDKVRTKLDDKGKADIDDLKISVTMQPLITIHHAGVIYQSVGKPMTPADPDQVVRAMVYEVTDKAPAWEVAMRHVMVQPTRDGLQVMEVLAVNNPSDRTWLGVRPPAPTPGATPPATAPAPVTLVIQLPATAKDIALGRGWDTDLATADPRTCRVVCSMPILPGSHEFGLTYTIPAKDGQATLDITAPLTVKQLMVFVSDDGTKISPTGLQGGQAMPAGDSQSVRMYQGQNLAADQKASLTVTGLSALPAAKPGAKPGPMGMGQGSEAPASGPRGAVVVAGAGGAVILVATAVVLAKSPKKKAGLEKQG